MAQQLGGCFAPPFTDAKLKAYKKLIDGLESSLLKDAMQSCYDCCAKWWSLPDSVGGGKANPVGKGMIIGLSESNEKALSSLVPHQPVIDMYASEFDKIDAGSQKELRDAAFHLLWHVVELSKKREPITNDKL